MERVRATIDRAVADGLVPSASICVRVAGEEVFHHTVGLARLDPARHASRDQAYDLASITKALATAPVVAHLLAAGRLRLDDPVARYLPEVDGRMRLAHLLTHASGLPWWRPFYQWVLGGEALQAAASRPGEFDRPPAVLSLASWGTAETRRAILAAARACPLEAAPGERHSYSDVGMLVLLQIIDAIADAPFDEIYRRAILEPAGVDDLRFGGWPLAAATEACPYRKVVVEGTVHDLNCAAMGGVSTHAGLFGTARAVALLADRLMHAVLAPAARGDLPGAALAAMWDLRGPGSHRGIWDSRSAGYTSTGQHWPEDSRGHLGFTGTSVWVAPSRATCVAFLTNRVHPTDVKEPIRTLRPLVYDAIAQDLGWVG